MSNEGPMIYTLVDTSSLEGIKLLKRAPINEILLWAKVFALQGITVARYDQLNFEELQYLYWNTTQLPPSDDKTTLVNQLEALIPTRLEVDPTTLDELKLQVPEDANKTLEQIRQEQETMNIMATDNAPIEKPKSKGKKKAAEAVEGGETAAAEVKEAKPKREKDPTGRPSEGTATRKVWDIADSLAAANGDVTPTRSAVIEASVAQGVNKATAGVQYGAWFKGMKRVAAPKPEPAPKAEETAAPATA